MRNRNTTSETKTYNHEYSVRRAVQFDKDVVEGKNGYLNISDILKCNQTFVFVVGARGAGKTFGAPQVVSVSRRISRIS